MQDSSLEASFDISYRETSSYEDDGGAAKDNHRHIRRKRKRVVNSLAIPAAILLVIWVLCQLQYYIDDRIVDKRHRNKAHVKKLTKTFQSKESEGDDETLIENDGVKSKYRWIDLRQVPPIENSRQWFKKYINNKFESHRSDYKLDYFDKELEWESLADEAGDKAPTVDYTKIEYVFPKPVLTPPRGGAYPPLEPMETLFKNWPQEDIDSPPSPFVEKLQHFDFNDPEQMEAALKYRDLEFPFKIYNIPEIDAAGEKWTDEYLAYHFDRKRSFMKRHLPNVEAEAKYGSMPPSSGKAQFSVDSFFAFFVSKNWDVRTIGSPPTMDTDLTYAKWAKHARYADAVGLEPNEPHYYWQSGVPQSERNRPKKEWTMISHDLPSFSDTEPNFFSFNPEMQKGIQCRFGERGVTAATHYDGGRNMVGMITGAKRYILSPPKECPKLGVVTHRKHPVYRHSMLNFGHINLLDKTDDEVADMPDLEKEWLEISKTGLSIDTVLKAGQVLYIPSHWFHYIISLQKSAQCNVRSGRELNGSPEFGGSEEVQECVDGNN